MRAQLAFVVDVVFAQAAASRWALLPLTLPPGADTAQRAGWAPPLSPDQVPACRQG